MAMIDHPSNLDAKSNIENISEITEFYAGCNVLLTGGSGFIGQLLIEKLLRSCPKIKKIYLILRAKKGKSSEERYKDLFADIVFNKLKQEQPHFENKIVLIEGEFNQSGLSISSESRELIKDSHIVFHSAATVRFDDKLRFAVNINVRGTKEIFLLCKQMPNIKAIVYIGTAFSHCIHKFIDEIFYDTMDSDNLLTLLDILNDEQLEGLTPILLGKYPNTYAFSKATAENVVLKHGVELPTCIVRPSIIIATEKEPLFGWINNIYGPTGLIAGIGIGLLHCFHCYQNNVIDIIPADYVVNNIIASGWDVGTKWQSRSIESPFTPHHNDGKIMRKNPPPIYNSVTSLQNSITWGRTADNIRIFGPDIPSSLCIWYYFFVMSDKLWLIKILNFVFHIAPAAIIDTFARLTGREPKLLEAYKKISKFTTVISYFSVRQWKFSNDNVLKLWDKMSPIDRKTFYFNVSELDWTEYFYYYLRGIRVFLIKDPLDNVEQSKKRYYKLKILHYTISTIILILLLWLVYILITTLYSCIIA